MLNPYLFFDGNCEAAFKFYEKTLDGKIEAIMHTEQAPTDAQCAMGDSMKGKVMHAFMRIGDFSLMASDSPREHFQKPQGSAVCLNYDDAAEAERIFKALSEGGTVPMPAGPTFFARFFGMCTDKFGTQWMVNCALPMGS
ncbi:MAG: VOC family protein [Xanthobacteraceae bacterium]